MKCQAPVERITIAFCAVNYGVSNKKTLNFHKKKTKANFNNLFPTKIKFQ